MIIPKTEESLAGKGPETRLSRSIESWAISRVSSGFISKVSGRAGEGEGMGSSPRVIRMSEKISMRRNEKPPMDVPSGIRYKPISMQRRREVKPIV